MKIKKYCLILMAFWLAACSTGTDRGVTITGEIIGLEDGELIYCRLLSNPTVEETAISEKGRFSMHVPVAAGEADWYQVSIGTTSIPDNDLYFYLDSGDVKISSKGSGFKDATYTGSAVTEYNAFRKFIINPDSVSRVKTWIREHPSSFLGTALLDYYVRSNHIENDTMVALFKDRTAKTNLPGKRLAKWIEERTNLVIGKKAPDFTMADTIGRPVKLSGFRGKYVLLDFWASWCGPCRAENPNVVQAFQKYKDKGFTVLGVSLDRSADKKNWLTAIKKDKLTWTHVSDLKYFNNAAARLYHVEAIPANFLIDPKGVIIAKDLRGEALNKKLAEIFGQ